MEPRHPSRALTGFYQAFWQARLDELEIPTRESMTTFLHEHATIADIDAVREYLNGVDALNQQANFRAMATGTGVPHSRARHCVRCHGTYTEATNTAGSCRVPHVFDAQGTPGEFLRGARVYVHQARCCEGVVLEQHGRRTKVFVDAPGSCFSGYHTADVAAAEPAYNDVNILRCKIDEDGKCVREFIEYIPGEPRLVN